MLNDLKSKHPEITIDIAKERLIWEQNLQRVGACDLYIDEFTLLQGDELVGHYGMSSIEAAALGKIVVSNNLWEAEYKKEYGVKPAVIAANSLNEMFRVLEKIILMSDDDRLALKKKTREWAQVYHSYQATGERVMKFINKML